MKVGRRLAMKVLNVSKFVLGSVGATGPDPAAVTEPVDRALLGKLARRARRGHARVRRPTTTPRPSRQTEKFFWDFCDDYVELVKERAYGDATATTPRPSRPARPWPPRCTSSCACSRRSCPTRPRRSGRGGSRARSTCRPGPPRPSSATRPAATRTCSRRSPPCSPASAEPSRPPRSACAPRSSRPRSPVPTRGAGGDPQCRARPARRRLDHRRAAPGRRRGQRGRGGRRARGAPAEAVTPVSAPVDGRPVVVGRRSPRSRWPPPRPRPRSRRPRGWPWSRPRSPRSRRGVACPRSRSLPRPPVGAVACTGRARSSSTLPRLARSWSPRPARVARAARGRRGLHRSCRGPGWSRPSPCRSASRGRRPRCRRRAPGVPVPGLSPRRPFDGSRPWP